MLNSWLERIKSVRSWRLVATILMLGLAAGMLFYLVYHERDVLLSYPWQFRPLPLLVAFSLYLIALWLAGIVWFWIVRSLGAQVHFIRQIHYFFISLLARRLPGTVWYVAYLAEMNKSEGFSPLLTSLGSGIELVVTLISGLLVSVLFAAELLMRYPLGTAGCIVLALGCLALLHPRPIGWLLRRLGSQASPPSTFNLVKWVSLYVVIRLLGGVVVYAVINIIYPLPIETLPTITGIWAVVGVVSYLVFFSLTNMGFTEVSLSLLLSPIIPSSIAVIVAVGLRILLIVFELVGALIAVGLNVLWRKPDK